MAATLLVDLRYGVRILKRNPGFTAAAVAALALAIGATTAIYTVVDGVLLRPLPFPRSEELVALKSMQRGRTMESSYLDAMDFRQRNQVLQDLAVYQEGDVALTGSGEAIQVHSLYASPSLLRVLGVSPPLGRGLEESDQKPGAGVAVLSHGLWQTHYQSDPGVVGRTVTIAGQPTTVLGVLPAGFRFPLEPGTKQARIFLPYVPSADQLKPEGRSVHMLRVVGRLKPGVTVQRAQTDLTVVAAQLQKEHPVHARYLGVQVATLQDQLVKPVKPTLFLLLAAVVGLLVVACTNVAGLMLARGTTRQREFGIRAALGADRGRIVRQLVAETAVLGLLGGALGVILAWRLMDVMAGLLPPGIPRFRDLAIDGRALAVTFGLSMVTALGSAFWPAIQVLRIEVNTTLQAVGRSITHAGGRRARSLVLIAEMSLSLVLLMAAGLTLRSYGQLQQANPGFRARGLVMAQIVELPHHRYPDLAAADRYYRLLATIIPSLPGAESVAFGAPIPFSDADISVGIALPQQPAIPGMSHAIFAAVSPGYLDVMKIPLLAGRDFNAADDRQQAASVTIVSETIARRMFGSIQNALGKRIQIGFEKLVPEIIGVSGDIQYRSLDQPISPTMYVSLGRTPLGSVGVVVRTSAPVAMIPTLRQGMLKADRELPPAELALVEGLIAQTMETKRALAYLVTMFALLALALATIGVYGLTSYTVTQRTREFGIRAALGADRSRLILLVLRDSLRLSAIAIPIGIALALATGQAAKSVLYGVSSADPVTLGTICLVIFGVSLLASVLPAYRATQVQPVTALRAE